MEEVHHAKEEGVIFDLLTNPVEILTDENDWVKGIKVVKMELGEPDASGRRRPVEIAGSEYVMEVDTVIMSLGTSPNPLISSTTEGLEINKRKCICLLYTSSGRCCNRNRGIRVHFRSTDRAMSGTFRFRIPPVPGKDEDYRV